MQTTRTNCPHGEVDELRREVADLRQTLARLSEATIDISENLDTEAVLQEVVNSV